jgi:hypothetical protein
MDRSPRHLVNTVASWATRTRVQPRAAWEVLTQVALERHPGVQRLLERIADAVGLARYDLKLWIGSGDGSAAYLPG